MNNPTKVIKNLELVLAIILYAIAVFAIGAVFVHGAWWHLFTAAGSMLIAGSLIEDTKRLNQ